MKEGYLPININMGFFFIRQPSKANFSSLRIRMDRAFGTACAHFMMLRCRYNATNFGK